MQKKYSHKSNLKLVKSNKFELTIMHFKGNLLKKNINLEKFKKFKVTTNLRFFNKNRDICMQIIYNYF